MSQLAPASHDIADYPVVLFDFDGTVADTVPAILRVATETLARHGISVPRERMLLMVGPPLEEGFKLISGVSEEDAIAFAAEYRKLFDEILEPADYPVMPGIVELLDALNAKGKRLAIATSRIEAVTCRMAEYLGLDQFEAIAGRVIGTRYSKTESIQAALDMLGVDASQAIMVGDRFYDVEGAAALGIPCVGVYTGAAAQGELEQAGALVTVHGTEELATLFGVSQADSRDMAG